MSESLFEALHPDDPRHGTPNGYYNLDCRCEACRAAWRDYKRLNDHIKGRHAPRETLKRHGPTRYRKGCRCDVCRAAIAAQKRRYRARHPEKVAIENLKRAERRTADD